MHVRALLAGFDRYIAKPEEPAELTALIAQQARQGRSRGIEASRSPSGRPRRQATPTPGVPAREWGSAAATLDRCRHRHIPERGGDILVRRACMSSPGHAPPTGGSPRRMFSRTVVLNGGSAVGLVCR